MERRSLLKIVKMILLVMWMLVIFFFSSQDATESSKLSNGLLSFLLGNLANSPILRVLIRKFAHVFEFCVLGFLLSINIEDQNKKYAFLFSLLYALSDEFHQHFVPGRAMALTDVLIDFIGASIGILLHVVIKKYGKIKTKRKSS